MYLEQFSIECGKTKPKFSRANHKRDNNPVNQSNLEVILCSRHGARENVWESVTIGFGFT